MKLRLVMKLFNIGDRDVVYNLTGRLNDSSRRYNTTSRKCMACGEEFESEGNHNRLCMTHRRDSQSIDIEMAQAAVK